MEFHFLYQDGFTPTEMEEIAKNMQNLSCIPEGSIPLSRRLGLTWNNLSQIPPDMENDYATEMIEKTEEFEPRVSVSEVAFRYDAEGKAAADVVLGKGEDAGDG